jgi:hypothetical protein
VLGIEEELEKELHNQPEVCLIGVSEIRRKLQTVATALDWLVESGVKVEADADGQGESVQLQCGMQPPRVASDMFDSSKMTLHTYQGPNNHSPALATNVVSIRDLRQAVRL